MNEIQLINGRKCINVPCAICNTLVWRRITHLHDKTFCSRECRSKHQKNSQQYNCSFCNKKIFKTPSQIKRSKSGKLFCNRSCSTSYNNQFKVGSKHPNWLGGRYRLNALEFYGARCCNPQCILTANQIFIPEILIDVHHIDENRKNNNINNLIPLCVWCHAIETRRALV